MMSIRYSVRKSVRLTPIKIAIHFKCKEEKIGFPAIRIYRVSLFILLELQHCIQTVWYMYDLSDIARMCLAPHILPSAIITQPQHYISSVKTGTYISV
jgi:hypothetical protein